MSTGTKFMMTVETEMLALFRGYISGTTVCTNYGPRFTNDASLTYMIKRYETEKSTGTKFMVTVETEMLALFRGYISGTTVCVYDMIKRIYQRYQLRPTFYERRVIDVYDKTLWYINLSLASHHRSLFNKVC
uniref:DUF4817 domain-containing protein n=1 Tax=Ascaris lumbricoides TaxID=6252 RepID=A0A0M3HWU7_ASCLU